MKIGIVGGLGWRSTVDYYAGICRLTEARHEGTRGALSYPDIRVESLNLARAEELLAKSQESGQWNDFDTYHREALKRLEDSGADFGLIACNTPHTRFDQILRGIDLPVLNIFSVAARRAASAGIDELLLLGTPLTMRSEQVRLAFGQEGVKIISPPQQLYLQLSRLIERLGRGDRHNAVEELASIATAAVDHEFERSSAVCLACTELALAFDQQIRRFEIVANDICYIDPAAAHIEEAFRRAVADGQSCTSEAGETASLTEAEEYAKPGLY
jgi:aspartate racemase